MALSSARRILFILVGMVGWWWIGGHGKEESGADVRFAFRPDATVMAVNDALDVGQPDTGAFKILAAVKALKNTKQFRGISHVETDAVVADKIDDVLRSSIGSNLIDTADFDPGFGAWARILERI